MHSETRSNIRNRHDAAHYDRYSATRMGPWDDLFISRAVEVCPMPGDNPLIVDIGTGSGVIPARMARMSALSQYRFLGLEYFEDMVEQGRQRIESEGLSGTVSIAHGDAHALPVDDGSVDLVLSRATIHHLADPVTALKEKFRVLRPGGVALIHDARRDAPAHILEMFNRMRAEVGYKPTTLDEKYTPEEMTSLLRQAGLDAHSSLHAGDEGVGAIGFEVLIRKPLL